MFLQGLGWHNFPSELSFSSFATQDKCLIVVTGTKWGYYSRFKTLHGQYFIFAIT